MESIDQTMKSDATNPSNGVIQKFVNTFECFTENQQVKGRKYVPDEVLNVHMNEIKKKIITIK